MLVGVVAYAVYKQRKDEARIISVREAETMELKPKGHPDAAPAPDFRTEKETVVAVIQERHREAAETMEDSLHTIFNDSDSDDVVSENSEALERIGTGLDDILK